MIATTALPAIELVDDRVKDESLKLAAEANLGTSFATTGDGITTSEHRAEDKSLELTAEANVGTGFATGDVITTSKFCV